MINFVLGKYDHHEIKSHHRKLFSGPSLFYKENVTKSEKFRSFQKLKEVEKFNKKEQEVAEILSPSKKKKISISSDELKVSSGICPKLHNPSRDSIQSKIYNGKRGMPKKETTSKYKVQNIKNIFYMNSSSRNKSKKEKQTYICGGKSQSRIIEEFDTPLEPLMYPNYCYDDRDKDQSDYNLAIKLQNEYNYEHIRTNQQNTSNKHSGSQLSITPHEMKDNNKIIYSEKSCYFLSAMTASNYMETKVGTDPERKVKSPSKSPRRPMTSSQICINYRIPEQSEYQNDYNFAKKLQYEYNESYKTAARLKRSQEQLDYELSKKISHPKSEYEGTNKIDVL